jgi:hypothetical protein
VEVKCSDGCPFVYRGPVGDKFLVLSIVLERHVRPEQAIHELSFLFLSAYAGKSSQE